jgi:hypothetical protein
MASSGENVIATNRREFATNSDVQTADRDRQEADTNGQHHLSTESYNVL